MKILINPKNLKIDDSWDSYRKVRAIIENQEGEIIISLQDGICIFPGGKCEQNEENIDAIKREILEETGIEVKKDDIKQVLELETFYDDFYNYRFDCIKSRHTITTYFYVKTNYTINKKKMNLDTKEQEKDFKIFFKSKEELENILLEDHSDIQNGKFFDEENKIVLENVINKLQ